MGSAIVLGCIFGFIGWFLVRYLVFGFYTVDQNERAVKTIFGRADRLPAAMVTEDPFMEYLRPEERDRYNWPQLRVIPPGGPYFKLPWEKIYKVSVATQTINMALDLEEAQANNGGTVLEAVTKDQLNTGLKGQIRYRISERNLYAYLFGVKRPIVHVMGYFISILRERIANFAAPPKQVLPVTSETALVGGTQLALGSQPPDASMVVGVSINDLRKNLRDLNEHMDHESLSSAVRYGIVLDAALITEIDAPHEVESALAAINTAHNQVSSDISLAQAGADQKIVQSRRAVEIETLKAQAEVEPLMALANQLRELKLNGYESLNAYVRNVRLKLFRQAKRVIMEIEQ